MIRATTLFETLIATSIITILIGIGSMIYSNIIASDHPFAFYQAKGEVDRLYHELKESRAYFSKTVDYEQFDIEQEVTEHRGSKRLLLVQYHVRSNTKLLWTEKHLIKKNEID